LGLVGVALDFVEADVVFAVAGGGEVAGHVGCCWWFWFCVECCCVVMYRLYARVRQRLRLREGKGKNERLEMLIR
jgi:hypothetical protein